MTATPLSILLEHNVGTRETQEMQLLTDFEGETPEGIRFYYESPGWWRSGEDNSLWHAVEIPNT